MQVTRLQGSPLSSQQTRLWLWQKESAAYRTLAGVEIRGILDRDVFKRRLSQIIEGNEILHTVFHTVPGMDVAMQVVGDTTLWLYAEMNLEQLPVSQQHVAVRTFFTSLHRNSYDLRSGPLFHLWLLRLAREQHILLMSLPALCADGY